MIVISGAGLAGLITAKILLNNKIYKPEEIILIDQERELGGLFKPYRSNKLGDVDKGMHIYYETLIDEIDSIVFKSINNYENGWIFLEGNLKDIAGAFYKGKLQINTPYPDLRNFEKNSFLNYQYEIINALKNIAESSNTKAIYKGLCLFQGRL